MPIGRPPDPFDPEIATAICERVAGGSTLAKISKEEGMKSIPTIYKWLRDHTEFANDYRLARQQRAETRNDRIDTYKEDVLGGKIGADVARIVIDAEKWQAGKENAAVYGDKVTLAGDAENPLQLLAVRLDKAVAARNLIDVTPVHKAIDHSDLL